MTSHVHDDLPMLLRGEADRATVAAAAEHLRGCEDCRQELISALVAHASLTSAARFAPAPAATVPERPTELPDLGPMFAQVAAEGKVAAEEQKPDRKRGGRVRWLAAAAVAGVAIGAGAVVVAHNVGNSPSSQTVQLAAYGIGHTPATAKVSGGDRMRLDATALPGPGTGKLYEVWLTNAARTQMYPIGSLGADRNGTFSVPPELMNAYSAIEVSVQPLDNSAYSGVSVLRGSYG